MSSAWMLGDCRQYGGEGRRAGRVVAVGGGVDLAVEAGEFGGADSHAVSVHAEVLDRKFTAKATEVATRMERMTKRMGRVICNITISADGYSAGLNQTEERPFGDDRGDGWGETLHACSPKLPRRTGPRSTK